MTDTEPSRQAKAGLGAACAACCAIPMLVVVGVVSLAAVAAASAAIGSLAGVGWVTWAFWARRLPAVTRPVRAALAITGASVAVAGLVAAGTSPGAGRGLVAVGVSVLSAAAMLALVSVRTDTARL